MLLMRYLLVAGDGIAQGILCFVAKFEESPFDKSLLLEPQKLRNGRCILGCFLKRIKRCLCRFSSVRTIYELCPSKWANPVNLLQRDEVSEENTSFFPSVWSFD